MGTEIQKPQGTLHFLPLGASELLSSPGPKEQEEEAVIKTIKERTVQRGILEGAVRLRPLQTSKEGAASPFPTGQGEAGRGGSVSAFRGRQECREGHSRSEGQTEAPGPVPRLSVSRI